MSEPRPGASTGCRLGRAAEIFPELELVNMGSSLKICLVAEGKAYRDFTPKEQREDKSVKEDIAERARTHVRRLVRRLATHTTPVPLGYRTLISNARSWTAASGRSCNTFFMQKEAVRRKEAQYSLSE